MDLAIIVPSVKGLSALPTLKAAISQSGFSDIGVFVAGMSCCDSRFVAACRELSPRIYTAPPRLGRIMPGMARNMGIDMLKAAGGSRYVLFVDDDILLHPDYAADLRQYLDQQPGVAAVMGRVISIPRTYWTQSIDFSNFWWLQTEKDIPDLPWLGAGATLTQYDDMSEIRFNEKMPVNEDVDFFRRIAASHKKKLAICAATTCEHHHARHSFLEFINYQFRNGKNSESQYHSSKISIRSFFIGIRNSLAFLKRTFTVNRRQLLSRPHLFFGVALSVLVYESGIQYGIYRKKNKN